MAADQEDLLRALRHPFRRSLLRRYLEAAEPLSPKELAEATLEPLSNVSYHVRELHRFGTLDLTGEQPARGSVEHFYKTTAAARRPWVLETLGLSKSKLSKSKKRPRKTPPKSEGK